MRSKALAVTFAPLNPTLVVVVGAVFVLSSALAARVLLRRLGLPSIITLLACGLLAGPSGIGLMRLDLTQPGTRALLSLAVVVVLFEATLRIDLRNIPKLRLALLAIVGPILTLLAIPPIAHAYHFSPLIARMIAAICVVTGPTVTGPLLARLRLRKPLSHLLETEGLVLDAIGVIIAAATFASFTSRPGSPLEVTWQAAARIATGAVVGIAFGLAGRKTMLLATRSSSDVIKIYLLLLGFGAYAAAEWLAHETGLVAVVACGLMLDFKASPHERLLRVFKEDLSMLALSTVFVLLASQIDVRSLGGLVAPAAVITGALILCRIVSVAAATARGPLGWRERILMVTMFPRGIVAVSLATYYATQLPAWGLHGANILAGVLFLIIMMTIVVSTTAAIATTRAFGLQMPSLIVAGISAETIEAARHFVEGGHLALLIDTDEKRVALARANGLEAELVSNANGITGLVRERNARCVIVEPGDEWDNISGLPAATSITTLREFSPELDRRSTRSR